MWPLLFAAVVSTLVVVERSFWWLRLRSISSPKNLEPIYIALEVGDIPKASSLTASSDDPVLQMIWRGLNHHHTSLENAMQVSAGEQLERAGKYLGVLDTIITLAPLLGLLGTVTGIMHSFQFVGQEQVAAVKVSGGIAEALIATAVGLTIAIGTVIPFNFFNGRLAKLGFTLQTAATNVEVLLRSSKPNLQ